MLWVSLLVRLRVEMPKIGLVQIDPDVSLLVRLRVEIYQPQPIDAVWNVSLLVRLRVEMTNTYGKHCGN